MTRGEATRQGFAQEMEKLAVPLVGLLAAPAIAAAGLGYLQHRAVKKKEKREKSFTKRLTGQYRPGAGMITPPRSY